MKQMFLVQRHARKILLSSTRALSSDFAGSHHSPVTEYLWRKRVEANENENKQVDMFPKVDDTSNLLIKPPSATRTTVKYNFSTDSALKDTYRNPWGFVRHGLLLEDLDALAGNTAAHHCSDGNPSTLGPMLVTASVDNVRMQNRLIMDNDLTLTGSVAWVGRSSMLIRMVMTDDTTNKTLMEAGFTFVARDRSDPSKSAAINHLSPETPEEVERYNMLQQINDDNKLKRKDIETIEENKKITNQQVKELVNQAQTLITMPSLVTENVMLMSKTRVENSIICQPQQRNMADRIFGGFLMRRAFELAFSSCYLHGGSRPHFVELERVEFVKPVDIGDLLRLVAHVTYAETEPSPIVHVEVVASVVNPEERTADISNLFNFTFALNLHLEPKHNQTMKSVIPGTEYEAKRHLIAKEYIKDNLKVIEAK
jgi:acyl-coenzyme A thioesterase 9